MPNISPKDLLKILRQTSKLSKTKKRQKNLSSSLLTIFIFVFVYWIFVITQDSEKTEISKQENYEKASQTQIISGIAKVTDGDTIIINQKRIRLIGIDAPEAKQKCLDKNNYEYWCGKMSTEFLKELIKDKIVDCFWQEKDIYKRFLGDCEFGQKNIQNEMLRSGMAVIYNQKQASKELKLLEREARKNKVGIWQGAFEEPKQYRKKKRK